MFEIIKNEKEIGKILNGLDRDSVINFFKAGPLLSLLVIDSYFLRGGVTPVPSVVSAKLKKITINYWEDISEYLDYFISISELEKNISDINLYRENIIELSKKPDLLLMFNIALFIESQMRVFSRSPFQIQETVINLTQPIFDEKEIFNNYESFSDKHNVSIYASMHAGKTPFVQVNHPITVVETWHGSLEAGTALIIPQLIDYTIKKLKSPEKYLFREIIHNEFLSWKKVKPKIGEERNWEWLPNFEDSEEKSGMNEKRHSTIEENPLEKISIIYNDQELVNPDTKIIPIKNDEDRISIIENSKSAENIGIKCAWCGGVAQKVRNVSSITREITKNYLIAYKYRNHFYSFELPICNSCEDNIKKRQNLESKGCSVVLWFLILIPIIFILLLSQNNGKYESYILEISLAFGGFLMFLAFIFQGIITSSLAFLLGYPKEDGWGRVDEKGNIHFKNSEFARDFFENSRENL